MNEIAEIGQQEHMSLKKRAESSSHRIRNENSAFWTEAGNASNKTTTNEFIYNLSKPNHREGNSEALFQVRNTAKNVKKESEWFKKYSSPQKGGLTLQEIDSKEDLLMEVNPSEETSTKKLFDVICKLEKEEFVAMYLKENVLNIANHGKFQAVLEKEGYAEPLTQYVPSEEEVKVTEHVLPQGKSQLILGSAGLWKSGLTPEEAAKIIYHLYQENPDEKDPEKASTLLRDEAMKRLTERGEEIPDISVMVVNLDIPEKGVTSLSDRRTQKAAKSYGRGMAA